MDFATWYKIALICILGAMSPGPSLAIIIRNTISGGRHRGVMAAVGHGTGVGVYALAVVTGLVLLLEVMPAIIEIVNWAGVSFLVWIGFQLIRDNSHKDKVSGESHASRGSHGFIEGFGVAFLNPKIAAFFLAVFSQFVRPDLSWFERSVMVLTAGIIDAVWYLMVALLLTGSGLISWLRSRESFVNRIIGGLLLICAGGLAWRAVQASN